MYKWGSKLSFLTNPQFFISPSTHCLCSALLAEETGDVRPFDLPHHPSLMKRMASRKAGAFPDYHMYIHCGNSQTLEYSVWANSPHLTQINDPSRMCID